MIDQPLEQALDLLPGQNHPHVSGPGRGMVAVPGFTVVGTNILDRYRIRSNTTATLPPS
ncbi:hypothetical protein AB0B25_30485 [Nocardia sp. NPDC049190]|uniref:hypothetical protein n=1 Tax=Nocardia sp. NPDC049190 TaxID=3155650 RepID=UPI0033F20C0B